MWRSWCERGGAGVMMEGLIRGCKSWCAGGGVGYGVEEWGEGWLKVMGEGVVEGVEELV